MSKEVMKQALNILEELNQEGEVDIKKVLDGRAALTTALALPDAQPVAATIPNPPTVTEATELLVSALRDAKGWMRVYARSLIQDAIDRVESQPATAPEPVEPDKERAVIEAAKEWSSERIPADHSEGELMKAVASLEGDWPGCEDCDHECDEPCMPATVVQMHASIDACLAKLEAKKAADARKHWSGIEQAAQPAS